MPSSHLILCHPFLLLPPVPCSFRVFSNESTFHMRWPKYWSFSFSISPSKEHPGLMSFRMAWLDLLAVQGTLKSLLQHHSSKASILKLESTFKRLKKNKTLSTQPTILQPVLSDSSNFHLSCCACLNCNYQKKKLTIIRHLVFLISGYSHREMMSKLPP